MQPGSGGGYAVSARYIRRIGYIPFKHHIRCIRRILVIMDAGQILRESRLRSGLSQRRLADLAGITQPTVARIESGLIQPTFERLLDLVRACGLDLDVRVVPLDEDAWTVARRGLELTPDERLDRAVAAVDLRREGRELREGNDG